MLTYIVMGIFNFLFYHLQIKTAYDIILVLIKHNFHITTACMLKTHNLISAS